MWMNFSLFKQFPTDIGFCQVFVITSSAAIKNLFAYEYNFIFLQMYLWDRFIDIGLLAQRANTYAILQNIAKFFPISVMPFWNEHFRNTNNDHISP